MRNNPRDWRIEDLKTVADRFGILYRQHRTSHVTFRSPAGSMVTVPVRRPIKAVYIKQFLRLIEVGEANEEPD